MFHKIIRHKPKNNNVVKNIIPFVIFPSSLVAKKREITGDVLSKNNHSDKVWDSRFLVFNIKLWIIKKSWTNNI